MKRLIIIRHGQTNSNKQGRLNSFEDIDINETGIEQAKITGDAIKNATIDLVISSPLKRARHTAKIVMQRYAEKHGVSPNIITDERLIELNFGELEGLTQDEIKKAGLWSTFTSWRSETNYINPKDAENFADAEARAIEFFRELLTRQEETILLVSHGHYSRIFISKCILGSDALHHRRLRFDNGKCIDIIIEEGKPRMIGFNIDKL